MQQQSPDINNYNAMDLANDLRQPDTISSLQLLANAEANRIFAL